MNDIAVSELNQMPLNDVINEYFGTFEDLCTSLDNLICSLQFPGLYGKQSDYSITLEKQPHFFEIDPSYVKSRISAAVLHNNADPIFIENLIRNKYNTIMLRLAAYDEYIKSNGDKPFTIWDAYISKENASISKAVFLRHVRDMCSMIESKPLTIGYFYDTIAKELEMGFQEIMGLFPLSTVTEKPDGVWIEEIIEALTSQPALIVNTESKEDLRVFFTSGRKRNNRYIQVNSRKYAAFSRKVHPLWEAGKIPKDTYGSWYDLIVRCVQQNGKRISKNTISSAIHGKEW